jgi:hypothetical protein
VLRQRALLIGIDHYDAAPPLLGCAADARAMHDLLQCHEDGTRNYDCRLFTSPGQQRITRALLRSELAFLFEHFDGNVLFYFSGHGAPTTLGGYLVTEDGSADEPGVPMNDLFTWANRSKVHEVLLILDCCYSGSLGNPPNLQGYGDVENQAQLREGITILVASRPTQRAAEVGGHGRFTQLLLSALSGGAADVRGKISAAAVYAYVEQALGAWEQRPLYKSHADCLTPVRCTHPAVPDALLRELPERFPQDDSRFPLAPSFEPTHPDANPDHVAIFNKLKILRDTRLLRTVQGDDLYFAALSSHEVELTPLGRFYWILAKEKRI